MLSKHQQKFILELKKKELFTTEQQVWNNRKWFYRNTSFLMRADIIKSRKNYDNKMNIYSLTDTGHRIAEILNKIKEVRF